MRFDKKLLLIAPTIVLFLVVAGMSYAAWQLHLVGAGRESLDQRSKFVAAVERGEKSMTPTQSAGLLRLGIQVEEKRTSAIAASRDLLIALSAMAFVACCTLAFGVSKVPREHWPRFRANEKS